MPFERSFSARIISLAIALALIGGGLIAPLGLDPDYAVPSLLMVAITMVLIGLVMGIHEQSGSVLLVGLVLPLALLPYSILLDLVARHHSEYSVALILAGVVPLLAMAIGGVRRVPSRAARAAQVTHTASTALGRTV